MKRHDETQSEGSDGNGRCRGRAHRRRSRCAHFQFDRPGLHRLCAGRRYAAIRPRAGKLPACADRQGVEMSGEVASMSLTAVAKAIAEKKVSSREVTRALLHRI